MNWLSRLFRSRRGVPDIPSPPPAPTRGTKVMPLDPLPPPPAPLSCFVRGIIRSLETEPEQWKPGGVYGRAYQHLTLRMIVYYLRSDSWDKLPGDVRDFKVTPAERQAILAALERYVMEPERSRAAEGLRWASEVHQQDLAARKVAFEKLGCPTPPTT